MRKLIRIHPDNPLRFENTSAAVNSYVQPRLRKLLINQRFDNIAAAAQQYFEELMLQWIENAVKATGLTKVACAGGLFLNVKLNKLLNESKELEDIFFYPAPDDEGSPVGAALQGYYEYCIRDGISVEHVPLGETYYGSSYPNDEITEILKAPDHGLHYEYYGDIKITPNFIIDS